MQGAWVLSLVKKLRTIRASLIAQLVKNLPAIQEDQGWIPGSERSSGERNGNPLQYSCLKKNNLMDRGSLVGYSPWGCEESNIPE